MKKRSLKTLNLSKNSVSNLNEAKAGGLQRCSSGSQHNSQCGYSCDPNLCGSVEPWGCVKE